MLLQEDSFYQDSINSVVISLILAVVVVLEATAMLIYFFRNCPVLNILYSWGDGLQAVLLTLQGCL